MKAREYQSFAIRSVFDYFRAGNTGNPVIAMPTGTGKSIIIAEFLRQVFQMFPKQKIIMATHVKELIEQNYDKLTTIWPTAPAGIYSAGVGRRDTDDSIIFGGIQSMVNASEQFGHVDLLLIDECHLVPAKSNTSYRKFIDALTKRNPKLKVIGLTATPYRLGVGTILDGGIFTDFCCDATTMEAFNWFIDEGYLAPLIPRSTDTVIDLTGVRKSGGEFVAKDLQAASDKEIITRGAVEEMLVYGDEQDRNHWLIFCTGVDHVHNTITILQQYGVSCVAVDGKMSKKQRAENIELFKSGKVRAMVNMGVLTTGFDAPFVDLIGVLRATSSPGLWVQILGRGTRPVYADGFDLSTKQGRLAAIEESEKQDCLVLDFARNTPRLGPINDPVLPKQKGKGGGDAPVRECVCGAYIHASLIVCPHCGMEYPPEVKFDSKSNNSELITKKKRVPKEPIVEVFKVDQIFFQPYPARNGKPPFVKVTYQCGLRTFKMPLCFEHESSYARKKSRDWWRAATNNDDADFLPSLTSEALERQGECETPKYIRVHINTKYPQIMFIDYKGELENECGKQTNLFEFN